MPKNPKHVAIILDGNRRWAKKLGMMPWKGHEVGLKKLEDLFNWSMDLGVNELTLYCFSTENFKRDKKEVKYLFDLFWKEFDSIQEGKGLFEKKVRVNVIGRLSMFDSKMQDAMKKAMQKTKKNKKLVVNLALAYGGRQEITDSLKSIIKQINSKKLSLNKINEETITKNLYLKNNPDIVIRPGGEVRTSNFLTWQSTYSEWFFMDKLWPEFTKKDLEWCIKEYHKRERRFGK